MIESYDPMVAPDPVEWLALSEDDATELVREYRTKGWIATTHSMRSPGCWWTTCTVC